RDSHALARGKGAGRLDLNDSGNNLEEGAVYRPHNPDGPGRGIVRYDHLEAHSVGRHLRWPHDPSAGQILTARLDWEDDLSLGVKARPQKRDRLTHVGRGQRAVAR